MFTITITIVNVYCFPLLWAIKIWVTVFYYVAKWRVVPVAENTWTYIIRERGGQNEVREWKAR